jgi:hypothetical protein
MNGPAVLRAAWLRLPPQHPRAATVPRAPHPAQWEELIERCQEAGVDAFEINFSCPHGMPERRMGMAMGQDCELLGEVCGWINAKATVPVWAKMTPNITGACVGGAGIGCVCVLCVWWWWWGACRHRDGQRRHAAQHVVHAWVAACRPAPSLAAPRVPRPSLPLRRHHDARAHRAGGGVRGRGGHQHHHLRHGRQPGHAAPRALRWVPPRASPPARLPAPTAAPLLSRGRPAQPTADPAAVSCLPA